MSKPKIAIIGGGIGGVTAAVALRHFGIDAVVFEKAAQIREAGAGLMLWANAARALQKLNLLEPILEHSGETDTFLVRKSGGEILMTIATGGLDVPSICAPRSFLLNTLVNSFPSEQIRLNHKFHSLSQTKNKVLCRFENSAVEEFDAVIGADGIYSRIRATLFGASAPIYHGYKIWRGVAKYEGKDIRRKTNSETWGNGKRFGILNMGRNFFTWYATANFRRDRTGSARLAKTEILNAFAGWHAPIPELIEATDENSLMENDACDYAGLSNWGKGLVTLLGDAAHPCTPNLGQGGGMAIEDALVLAKCIAGENSLPNALRRYESLRLARTAHIQQRARLMGFIGQWENSLLVSGRHLVTKILPAKIFEYNLKKTYSYQT